MPPPGAPTAEPAAGLGAATARRGSWGPAAPPPPGVPWRPQALQPGIIPLRPLGMGEIYDGAFRAVRANPRVMFGLAALVVTVAVILQSVIQWYVKGIVAPQLTDLSIELDPSGQMGVAEQVGAIDRPAHRRTRDHHRDDHPHGPADRVREPVRPRPGGDGRRGPALLARVARRRLHAAERHRGPDACSRSWSRGVTLLAANDQVALAVLLGLGGSAAFVVAAVWFVTRTLLVPPALMLEGKKFWPTISRAWRLTYQGFWRLFGIYLLTAILAAIIA